ncbi:MAG: hypothetical protein AB3N33_09360 [Puniceicoccaceae bacterium]
MNARTIPWISLLSLLLVQPAVANDTFPASYRGEPLSVEAHWTNLTLPIPPETTALNIADSFNSVDDAIPATTLYSGEPFASTSGGAAYITMALNAMSISVPNWIDDMPLKKVRVQISYTSFGGFFNSGSLASVSGTDNGGPISNWTLVNYFDSPDPPVSTEFGQPVIINTAVYDIEIEPNPDWEVFNFSFPAAVTINQVDIDTVSVPEPSLFAAALGLTALGFILRRRSLALRQ